MNKLAVTLAADSAVTIGSGEATKVYNSAEKIFEGTNHDPIGVMVYNSPELNGVPVESIVKMYRDAHCNQQFATVFDYAEAFLHHIENLEAPDLTIANNIQALAAAKLIAMRGIIRQATDDFFRALGSGEKEVSPDQIQSALETEVLLLLETEEITLRSIPSEPWSEGIGEAEIATAHGECLTQLVEIFQDGDPFWEGEIKERLVKIAILAVLKEYQRPLLTGLVFAGFGRDEIFPSLVAYEVYGVVAGRLKQRELTRFDVDRKLVPDAAIFPFAQKEMVDRFVYGLDGEFLDLAESFFAGALTRLKEHLGGLLGEHHEAKEAISPAIDVIVNEFRDVVVPNHLQRSSAQLSDMVRSMPKQELAALSESLVHITSLKRKFSAGAESVGGPIDVAMITRAEGFVWVKRKHYFDPSLNPRYFYRRYGSKLGNGSPESAASPVGKDS
jgi:hypothetical protein